MRVGEDAPAGAVTPVDFRLAKLPAIRRALHEADLVLWLDCDAMIVEHGTCISGEMHHSWTASSWRS